MLLLAKKYEKPYGEVTQLQIQIPALYIARIFHGSRCSSESSIFCQTSELRQHRTGITFLISRALRFPLRILHYLPDIVISFASALAVDCEPNARFFPGKELFRKMS